MNREFKHTGKKELGYELLQPSILGGIRLWTTDLVLSRMIKNSWSNKAKEIITNLKQNHD